MRKNVIHVRIILIGLTSLITLVIWIAAEINHQYINDTITPEYESQILPINPRLPIEVLDQIEAKNRLPVDLNQTESFSLPLTSTPPYRDDADLNFVSPIKSETNSNSTFDTIPQ